MRINLDYGKVRARRIGRAGRAKIAPGGQSLDGRAIRWVGRLPHNKIGLLLYHAGKLTQLYRARRDALHHYPAILHNKVGGRSLQHMRGKLQSFFFDGFRCQQHGGPGYLRNPTAKCANAVAREVAIIHANLYFSRRQM